MALDATVLADGFLDLQSDPPADEAAAILRMATILSDYFKGAAANTSITINAGAVDAQLATIQGALAGMKAAGPAKIQAACLAFWGVVVAGPTPFFAGCAAPAVISPGLSLIAADMLTAAAANIADELAPADACQALADAIHADHTTTPTTVTLTSGPTVVPVA